MSTARRQPAPQDSHKEKKPKKASYFDQTPRRDTFARTQAAGAGKRSSRRFNYELDYRQLDLRQQPDLYRVGVGEQGVLLVEPYKGEILPLWKFKTPAIAQESSQAILKLFRSYKRAGDFVGMDMCRKFLQMGYTRSRRYANHASGRKYDTAGKVLPIEHDEEKAQSAQIFHEVWQQVEADPSYAEQKRAWKARLG